MYIKSNTTEDYIPNLIQIFCFFSGWILFSVASSLYVKRQYVKLIKPEPIQIHPKPNPGENKEITQYFNIGVGDPCFKNGFFK